MQIEGIIKMKQLLYFTTILLFFNFAVFSREAYRLDDGIYEVDYSEVELCIQKVRTLYDDDNILGGIYVSYQGYCGDVGPYYYFCNEGRITNECYNIGHRFKIIRDNTYYWENETVNIFGIFSKR